MKCWDCGSTINGHHTRSCDLAGEDDVRDLPELPGTQWWIGGVPSSQVNAKSHSRGEKPPEKPVNFKMNTYDKWALKQVGIKEFVKRLLGDPFLEAEPPAPGAPPPKPEQSFWIKWNEYDKDGVAQARQKKFFSVQERDAFAKTLSSKKGFISVAGQGQGEIPGEKKAEAKVHVLVRALIESRVDTLKDIVDKGVAKKIDGMKVDMQTANLLLQIYNALSPANQVKFETLPLQKLVNFAWRQVKKSE